MPQTTAQQRNKGIKAQRGFIAPNCRLTPAQKESLNQWILLMDQHGMPFRATTVRQMASLLAAQHAKSQPIGK